MPIVIPKTLPAFDILSKENIFVMPKVRADSQDIRPIEIAIVNLMPTKIETETQLMRLLGNSSLQVHVTLVGMESYKSTHISQDHMNTFYTTFSKIKNKKFDGLIVTGAPVEQIRFEDVKYWKELEELMNWADKNVTSTIYICWAAYAALYHFYGIDKKILDKKLSGIYPVKICDEKEPLLRGMDDIMYIPMSRYTTVEPQEITSNKNLKLLGYGDECGVSIVKSTDDKKIFLTGHSEYARETLKTEYIRDVDKGLEIEKPINYFIDGDINKIDMKWRSTANLIYYNWLNYYVYQVTPYELK
jgi:homoserine O-succinyltransferase/O-acetyltransferase